MFLSLSWVVAEGISFLIPGSLSLRDPSQLPSRKQHTQQISSRRPYLAIPCGTCVVNCTLLSPLSTCHRTGRRRFLHVCVSLASLPHPPLPSTSDLAFCIFAPTSDDDSVCESQRFLSTFPVLLCSLPYFFCNCIIVSLAITIITIFTL